MINLIYKQNEQYYGKSKKYVICDETDLAVLAAWSEFTGKYLFTTYEVEFESDECQYAKIIY